MSIVRIAAVWRVTDYENPSFNLGSIDSTNCVGALAGQDIGLGSNVWLLGDR